MKSKKPSIATQLKLTTAELNRVIKELEDVKKAKASAESTRDYYSKESSELQKQVNEIHNLLDVFEGALPRKKDDTYTDHSVMVRLASWLANKK